MQENQDSNEKSLHEQDLLREWKIGYMKSQLV